ncbi:unnamed protein product [Rotaria sp. Silwood1]|nr:unnamed protein product [Rotaria sp. Silwood1]CAF3345773.1 unnamed protein product [Rotaria sp. Silwood1]CAF4528577.1 unnamed protein product [Rotaria sp. Silwood1]CAF4831831.1 unnamed protein product [Rotaria sp. Silwood1]
MYMMHRLDQGGQTYSSDKQTALEDRYYNNQSFQDDFPIDDPNVNSAATKIQAQFRGHKARRDLEKIKREHQQSMDSDQHETSFDHEELTTENNEYQKSSPLESQRLKQENQYKESIDDEELTEEEKFKLERAAISIQAQFRGFQVRKHLRDTFDETDEQSQHFQQEQQEFDNDHDKTSVLSPTHSSDHRDLGENLRLHDEIEMGKNDDIDRPHLEREPTQLSDDFERHTDVLRDINHNQEQLFNDEDDMSDSNLDKAATRIQASYRGYKTRKELGSVGGHSPSSHDQQHSSSSSSPTHKEYDNGLLSPSAEGNKVPAHEDHDDNAAAVKIQAAYRGYRVRKDLEK